MFGLLFILLVFCQQVRAGTPVTKLRAASPPVGISKHIAGIRTFAEFMELTEPNRLAYLQGLSVLIGDLEADDIESHMSYQSASFRWIDGALEALMPSAAATTDDKRCIYAGWISSMDMNGRYCLRPLACKGQPGRVQCNPVVYGNVCAPAGKTATAFCRKNRQPQKEILRNIASKKEDWDTLRSDLKGYCESPRPSQKNLCAVLESRVAQLERVVGSSPVIASATRPASAQPEPAVASEADEIPVAPRASSRATHLEVAPGVTISPIQSTAAGTRSAQSSADNFVPSKGWTINTCTKSSLFGTLQTSGQSAQGTELMPISDAIRLMCSNEPIDMDVIAKARDRVRARQQTIGQVREDQAFYKKYYASVSANLEACLVEAKATRSGRALIDPGDGATVRIAGPFADFWDSAGKFIYRSSAYTLEGAFRSRAISLCKTRVTIGDGGGASPSSPSSATSSAPASR